MYLTCFVKKLCSFILINAFFIVSDNTLPEEKAPNVAFFYILIKIIEESETLHLQYDLLRLLPKLGLRLPDHVSSFLRFVRRNTDKAFRKKKFSPLSQIPAPVLPKPSNDIVGLLCRDEESLVFII